MSQGKRRTTVALAMVLMAVIPAWAETDYSSMSNEELSQKRGTMREAGEAEQNAFRSEWQQRTRDMTMEERQQYSGPPANATADGSGSGQGMGQGRGGGRRMGR
ncbi:MAG: DUF1104 domain-containing protein [Desulfobulbaceae bacterium]|nr:DUF1104 domain-containing protein [Desulfobulbaceae bacterium]